MMITIAFQTNQYETHLGSNGEAIPSTLCSLGWTAGGSLAVRDLTLGSLGDPQGKQ